MAIARLYTLITTPRPPGLTAKTGGWFGLSLAIALLFAAMALHQGLSGDRLVQDDARQFLFWMQRFQDPQLFPDDLIADYFQSVTPLGFIAVYRLGAALGVDPFTLNLFIPLVLSLVTTAYFFWLVMAIVPLPFTSFLACLLLNQTLWMKDDLVSATPRSFVYPLFLAFLYYLLDVEQGLDVKSRQPQWRSPLLGGLALALLGVFYPQYVLVAGGMVVLMLLRRLWQRWQRTSTSPKEKSDRLPTALVLYLGIILAVLAFYGLTSSDYGPVITVEQARSLPEFWPGGRSFFFSDNLWWFYAVGDRSGFLHVGLVRPASLCFGVFLPIILWRQAVAPPMAANPILRALTPQVKILGTLLLSASGLFVLAHLLLFRLHLPSRYTDHSLRIILAIAAAIVLTLIIEWLLRESVLPVALVRSRSVSVKRAIALGTAALLVLLVILYPAFVEDFPLTKYKQGNAPRLYAFFQQQQPATLVASLSEEANNIPVFAQRSILVGREYAIPYHLGYYREFRDRALALIHAQYSPDAADVERFIHTYGIDFWMLDADAFDADYLTQQWTHQYLDAVESTFGASANLNLARSPALESVIQPCTVAREGPRRVLDARCISDRL
ncbi:MAG: hypothetical protein WBA57_25350 [Elainellaceae cyanobacterium]